MSDQSTSHPRLVSLARRAVQECPRRDSGRNQAVFLNVAGNIRPLLKGRLECENRFRKSRLDSISDRVRKEVSGLWRQTYRKSPRSLIIVDGLVDCKVGIGDFVTQEIRAVVVVVVLAQDSVVFRDKFVFVRIGFLLQVGDPTGLHMISLEAIDWNDDHLLSSQCRCQLLHRQGISPHWFPRRSDRGPARDNAEWECA